MNDPHVVALNYRIEHASWVDWSTAEPLELHEDAFSVRVEDMRVRFLMKEHHATEDDACTAVEDYLRAWEFDAALRHDPGAFKLRFVRSEIEDRNPAPGTVHALASPITATAELGVARGTVLPPSYPAPPSTGLRSDPDVERMFNRYAKYRDRREPLTSMTYFCLNVLEESTGDRPKAAKRYGISKCVLDQLGNLSSIRGGSDARKAAGVHHDLTGQESQFLEAAVKAIIRRAAEYAYDPNASLRPITMRDLQAPQSPSFSP